MADGFGKLDQVEKSINSGDAKAADGVLATIGDRGDQELFKGMIAKKCTANDGLPSCTIDMSEGDGSIHFGGEHKMTMTDDGVKLGMRDDQPSMSDRFKEAVSGLKDTVVNFVNDIDPAKLVGSGIAGDDANKLRDRDNEIKKHVDR
jgi:hypothetical protein